MKVLGIAVHSAEGGALCFITACREGDALRGAYRHPSIVLSALPMGPSLPAWEQGDHETVARHLAEGVRRVAAAGADFYVCPDNTAHIVLERIAGDLPIPGLHIADVVCHEIGKNRWKRVGLLGTAWTMDGPVYARALEQRGLERLVPDAATRNRLHAAIFDELCMGLHTEAGTALFVQAIAGLKARGAECVILGCTEIPLVITERNSPLPILDSTRLLAKYAVREAVSDRPIREKTGWLPVEP